MKKILIIGGLKNNYKTLRAKEEAEKLGLETEIIYWKDLTFYGQEIYADEGRVELDGCIGALIQSPMYYRKFKTVFNLDNELYLLCRIFRERNIKLLNEKVIFDYPYYDKFNQAYIFDKNDIATITTIHLSENNIKRVSEMMKSFEMSYPVIVKDSRGGIGIGVDKMDSQEEMESFLEDKENVNLIFQPFLENGGDYRVLVVNGKSMGIMKRIAEKGEWKNNFSRGAKIEAHDDTEMEKFAEDVCGRIGFDFAGVDVFKIDGKNVVIEVNMFPGFEGFEKIYPKKNIAKEVIKKLVA